MKKCTICKQIKLLENFYSDKSRHDKKAAKCNLCNSQLRKKYIKNKYGNYHNMYLLNKDKIDKQNKIFYYKHQNKKQEFQRNYYHKNKQKIKELRKTHKLNKTIEYKLKCILRARIAKYLSGQTKNYSAVAFLGCSLEQLKQYLESKFQPGMTWENRGRSGWHIDHIIPLKKFNLQNEEDFKKASHYTNLQPLWWYDNLRKSAK